MFKPIIIVPVFNHHQSLNEIAHFCQSKGLPVLMIDDASNAETKAVLRQVNKDFNNVYLETHQVNGGKGAAVITAIRKALELGYSHALQIDADLQQDIDCVPKFLEFAMKSPNEFICGFPIYDHTVPSSRKWGRKLTNFWVCINTLSSAIKDAMCGFRVYPLRAACATLNKYPSIGRRMDFDPEYAVKLYWEGINVTNVPVPVTYPSDGVSHFHAIENWYITKMHTRLFFGMILRFPRLLARHF